MTSSQLLTIKNHQYSLFLFTAPKENYTLIRNFWRMYICFDDYPTYTGAISEVSETKLMPIFNAFMTNLI